MAETLPGFNVKTEVSKDRDRGEYMGAKKEGGWIEQFDRAPASAPLPRDARQCCPSVLFSSPPPSHALMLSPPMVLPCGVS